MRRSVKPKIVNTVGLREDGGFNPHAVFERPDRSLGADRPGVGEILELEIGVLGHSLRRIVGGLGQ